MSGPGRSICHPPHPLDEAAPQRRVPHVPCGGIGAQDERGDQEGIVGDGAVDRGVQGNALQQRQRHGAVELQRQRDAGCRSPRQARGVGGGVGRPIDSKVARRSIEAGGQGGSWDGQGERLHKRRARARHHGTLGLGWVHSTRAAACQLPARLTPSPACNPAALDVCAQHRHGPCSGAHRLLSAPVLHQTMWRWPTPAARRTCGCCA